MHADDMPLQHTNALDTGGARRRDMQEKRSQWRRYAMLDAAARRVLVDMLMGESDARLRRTMPSGENQTN